MLLPAHTTCYRVYTFTTWRGENLAKPLAKDLINMLKQKTEEQAYKIYFVPTSGLRAAGWQFADNELVGEPQRVSKE